MPDTVQNPLIGLSEALAERAKLAPFAEYRSVARRTGQVTYRMGARKYERRLGNAKSGLEQSNGGYMAGFTGAHKGREPVATVDHDVHSRITDMDYEGVDVNLLLPSGWFGAADGDWPCCAEPACCPGNANTRSVPPPTVYAGRSCTAPAKPSAALRTRGSTSALATTPGHPPTPDKIATYCRPSEP